MSEKLFFYRKSMSKLQYKKYGLVEKYLGEVKHLGRTGYSSDVIRALQTEEHTHNKAFLIQTNIKWCLRFN